MLTSLKRQFSKYLHVLGWLAHDFVWRYRRRAAIVLVCRFAGMGLFVATLGVLAYYIRLIERDSSVRLFGESVQARESVMLLALVGAAFVVMMAVGATLTLLGNRENIRLSLEYEKFCGRRVMRLAGRAIHIEPPENVLEAKDEAVILTLAKKYPRFISRAVRPLLGSVLPGLFVIAVIVPILFSLHSLLSAIVLVLAGASLALHYRVSVYVAGCMRTYEHSGKPASNVFRKAIQQFVSHMHPVDDAAIDEVHQTEPVRRNLSAYAGRQLGTDYSQFVSDIFGTLTLVTILVVLGANILTTGEGWAVLVVYLLALRYGLGQLKGMMAGVASVNQYFHQVYSYFQFIKVEHEPLPESLPTEAVAPLTIRCKSSRPHPGSESEIVVYPGQRLLVFGVGRLNRFRLHRLYEQLFDSHSHRIRNALASTQLYTKSLMRTEPAQDQSHSSGAQTLKRGSDRTDVDTAAETAIAVEARVKSGHGRYAIATYDAAAYHALVGRSKAMGGSVDDDSTVVLIVTDRPKDIDRCAADFVAILNESGVAWVGRHDQLSLIKPILRQEQDVSQLKTGDTDGLADEDN